MEGKSSNTIHHKSSSYELKVTYCQNKNEENNSSSQESLLVYLKIFNQNLVKRYRNNFTKQTTPKAVLDTFSQLDIVFQCFRDEKEFEIGDSGNISIKGTFEIQHRKIFKNVTIQLQSYEISETDVLLEKIQQLKQQVAQLNNNKQQVDTIRKQFEKREQKIIQQNKIYQRRLQQKSKQQQMLRQKQAELKLRMEKQSAEVKQLSQKLVSTEKQHLCRLKQLQKHYQATKLQSARLKQELQIINARRHGGLGRKMTKPNQLQQREEQQERQQKQNRMKNQGKKQQSLVNYINRPTQTAELARSADKSRMQSNQLVDSRTVCFDKFAVEGNSITYIGEDDKQTMIVIKRQIPKTYFSFQIKIIKTKQREIMVGVVEISEAFRMRYSDKKSICYWGRTGFIWGQTKCQGLGFEEGDIVRVNIDLKQSYIQWKVNDVLQASSKSQLFNNCESKIFVPFIEMNNVGDCVIWQQAK